MGFGESYTKSYTVRMFSPLFSYADPELPEETARRNLKALIKDGLVEEFKKPNEHKQRKFFRLIERGF